MTHYQAVKASIYQERMNFVTGAPACEICGLPVPEPSAHHAIISKQYARGWPPDLKDRIDHPYNLSLVHEANQVGIPCHKIAHAKPIILVARLVDLYGYDPIEEWLNEFELKSAVLCLPLSNDEARQLVLFWNYPVMQAVEEIGVLTTGGVMEVLKEELKGFPQTAELFSRSPLVTSPF